MEKSFRIFSSINELAKEYAEELAEMIIESAKKKKPFSISLSGGSTPGILFTLLGEKYSSSIPWQFVHLFWGDERCVPPDNPESNFGMTSGKLITKIDIPSENVHRIKGEDDPQIEALRYSDEILHNTERRDGIPLFDLVILGVGDDGHTASIFPGQLHLMGSDKICDVAIHPLNKQKRITITGRVINNAANVTFLVTGKKKANVVEEILHKKSSALNYPASHIVPVYGNLSWFLDKEAGSLL